MSGFSSSHAHSIELFTYLTNSRIWRQTASVFSRASKMICPSRKFTLRHLTSHSLRSSRSVFWSMYIRVLPSVGDCCTMLSHSFGRKVCGWTQHLSPSIEIV